MSFVVDLNKTKTSSSWPLWQVVVVFPLLYLVYGATAAFLLSCC